MWVQKREFKRAQNMHKWLQQKKWKIRNRKLKTKFEDLTQISFVTAQISS